MARDAAVVHTSPGWLWVAERHPFLTCTQSPASLVTNHMDPELGLLAWGRGKGPLFLQGQKDLGPVLTTQTWKGAKELLPP